MKTLRLFSTILMVVTLCFGFAACDNDDDEDNVPPTSLVGTTWAGTETNRGDDNNYHYRLQFTTATTGRITVTRESTNQVEDEGEFTYSYNSSNYTFTGTYLLSSFSGSVVNRTHMKFARTANDDSVDLYRQ